MTIMCARCRRLDDVGCSSELCETRKEVGPLCDNVLLLNRQFYDANGFTSVAK